MDSPFSFPCSNVVGLKAELRTELADAGAADGVRDYAKIDRVLQIAVRISKVDSIEHVEKVEPKFEAHSFVDACVLSNTQIETM